MVINNSKKFNGHALMLVGTFIDALVNKLSADQNVIMRCLGWVKLQKDFFR